MNVDVNYLAVVVGAVVIFVLGWLWYGPFFGKKWIALSKFTPEEVAAGRNKGMKKQLLFTLLGALITSYVLWHASAYATGFLQQSGLWCGVSAGFWAWLGFVFPGSMSRVLWEGRDRMLVTIDSGYYLA